MAADGQTLATQPSNVQQIFTATYGANAGAQWDAQHNAATNAGSGAVPSTMPQDQASGLSGAAATLQNSAAQTAINAATQKALQAYQEATIAGQTADRAEKAAEFAATNELAKQAQAMAQQSQNLAAQNQAYTQGMGVLNLVAGLQGPANAFTQQAVLHGLDANGLSRAVGALSGTALPTFSAPQATPQAASLQSLIGQVYPGATFNGQGGGTAQAGTVPSISSIMQNNSTWAGAPAGTATSTLTGDNLTAYKVLTAPGGPAAGISQDTFQAYMNANGGARPPDGVALAQWAAANPNASAAGTAQAQSTVPTAMTTGPNGASFLDPGKTIQDPNAPNYASIEGSNGGSTWAGTGTPYTGTPAPLTSGAGQTMGGQIADSGPQADPKAQATFRQLMGLSADYMPGKIFTPADVQASGGYANAKAGGFATYGGVDPLTTAGTGVLAAQTGGSSGGATTADYVNGLPAPNKIVSRDFNALDPDTQKFLLAAYQQAGYSANDVTNAVSKTLPQFAAPSAGQIAA